MRLNAKAFIVLLAMVSFLMTACQKDDFSSLDPEEEKTEKEARISNLDKLINQL